MKNYYYSRLLANWKHMSTNHDTSGPMDMGALKGKGRYKGFGKDLAKEKERKVEKTKANSKGHGKDNEKEKGIGKEKAKERQATEKGEGKGTVVSFVDRIRIGVESVLKSRVGAIVEDSPESKDDDWSWNWNEDWNGHEGWIEDD